MIGARAGQLWRRVVAGLESLGLESPGLESWRHRWSAWWADRSGRERALLGGLAAVAIVAVILAGVIVPLRDLRAGAYQQLHEAAVLDAQLRLVGGQGGGTGGGSGPRSAIRRGTASAILTDSAAAARLSIQRMEPEGGNTRVELGDAPFNQVVTWLADVERNSRLRVQQSQIDRKGAPGIVSASFVFSG
jgi:general secretion pathway protein M